MGIHVVDPMHNLHFCHYDHFVHESVGQWQEWPRKGVDFCLQNRPSYLLVDIFLYWYVTIWETFNTQDTIIFTSFEELCVYSSSPNGFLPVFQFCSFQVLCSSKPLGIANKSVYKCTSVQIKCLWTARSLIEVNVLATKPDILRSVLGSA